jgi:hypothetical protein
MRWLCKTLKVSRLKSAPCVSMEIAKVEGYKFAREDSEKSAIRLEDLMLGSTLSFAARSL